MPMRNRCLLKIALSLLLLTTFHTNVASSDTVGPVVQIDKITERDLRLRLTTAKIKVTGVATDVDGIDRVTINGVEARLSHPSGKMFAVEAIPAESLRFEAEISLQPDQYKVVITAVDRRGNQSYKFIAIQPAESIDAQKPDSKKWAFLIGIEDYEDEHITDLRYSVDDVRLLYEVLVDSRRGAFDYVRLLTSEDTESQKRPTRRNIFRGLRNWLSQTKPDDTVLFYFSGHGIADKDGQNYLIAVDTEVSLPQETAVSMKQVNAILNNREQIPAKRIIVVLDSCHSGVRRDARSLVVQGQILSPLFEDAEGRITLASCNIDEQSFEDEDIGHGVFTYFFVEGLKGNADQSRDGLITASELNNYVYTQVTTWAKNRQLKQTPRKQENVSGEFVLAFDPQRLGEIQQQQIEKQRQIEFQGKRSKLFQFMGIGLDQLLPYEISTALGILEKHSKGEALSDVEEKRVLLVEDLVADKIDVLFYKQALKRLTTVAGSPDQKPEPPTLQEPRRSEKDAKQAIAKAELALDAAEAAWALTLAPKDYEAAENLLDQAHSLLRQNKFNQAKATAVQAEKRANISRDAAVKRNSAVSRTRPTAYANAKAAIDKAQLALNDAKAAGALTYAPNAYQEAERLINQAHSLHDQNEFDRAKATAAQAEERATQARNAAQQAAKREAYTNAKTAIDKAQMEIDRAERVNALEHAETLFQDATTTLELAKIALKAEQYEMALRFAAQAESSAREAHAVAAEVNEIIGTDGTPMVLILAGEFLMGSEDGMNDEKPVHQVYLDAYYIDKFEVTVRRYREFVEATGHPPPDWEAVKKYSPTDNCPMILVSWDDAMAYAQWGGKILPTEAQWEKAARGGLVQKDYPTGDSISHDDANYRRIFTLGLTTGKTVPVNRYPSNGYGLYSMAGNVWEWCFDHYDKKFYRQSPKDNPLYIDKKKPDRTRVLRGGSWDSDNYDNRVLRCAYRNHFAPSKKDITLGFRCVMKVPE